MTHASSQQADFGELSRAVGSRQQRARLPWSLVAAAIVAFVNHGFTSNQLPLMSLLSLALVASQLTARRLPESRSISRAVRVVLFTVIIAIVGWPRSNIRGWFMWPDYTNLIGCALAAEIAVRAWEFTPAARATILLLATLVFGCSSNTTDRDVVSWLAPLYITFVMFALRTMMSRVPVEHAPRRLASGRFICGAVTIVIGFMTVATLDHFQRQLSIMGMELFRKRPPAAASDIGLTGAPQLTATFNPQPSMERILIIDGPRAERYLRVLAFDTLNGNQWHPVLRVRDRPHVTAATLRGSLGAGENAVSLHIRIVGDTFDVLPLPLSSTSVTATGELLQDEFGSLTFAEPPDDPRFDALVSSDPRAIGPLNLPLNDGAEQRKRALAPPDKLDPRIAELARTVAGDGDPQIRIGRILQHLQATHEYSLQYNPGTGDALADFILNNRAAHCEYFASAMVVMARAVGVPARMATGYYAHETAGDNRMVVRDRDAHSWAECWYADRGWTTVDATPAGGKPDQLFGDSSRWRSIWEAIQDFPTTVRDWIGGISQKTVITTVLISAGFILIWGTVQIIRKRRFSSDLPYTPASDPQLATVARRFEKWLKRAQRDQAFAANRTWREYVQSMENHETCLAFLNTYDEARFGGANGQTLERLKGLLERLEQRSS